MVYSACNLCRRPILAAAGHIYHQQMHTKEYDAKYTKISINKSSNANLILRRTIADYLEGLKIGNEPEKES